jgi:hypothetical protein
VIDEAFPVEPIEPPRSSHSSERDRKKTQNGMTRERRLWPSDKNAGTAVWRKLGSEELHNLYSSPNIIGMFKSRGMK